MILNIFGVLAYQGPMMRLKQEEAIIKIAAAAISQIANAPKRTTYRNLERAKTHDMPEPGTPRR